VRAKSERSTACYYSLMMNTNRLDAAFRLSDDDLLIHLEQAATGRRTKDADLIALLSELARRKNHRGEGEGTVFKHCTQVLKLSAAATSNRLVAANAARRFPLILDLLDDGSINLTTVRVLAGVLTAENHAAILREASGKTKDECSEIKARLDPKPAVATTIQRLPVSAAIPAASLFGNSGSEQSPTGLTTSAAPVATAASSVETRVTGTPPPSRPRPVLEPLAPELYKVQFTVDKATYDRLRRIQDLMRREIPTGDAAVIFARALVLLEQRAEKKAFSATTRPRTPRGTKPGSRTIPAHVEREVWARDDGRCAFVGRSGMRCSERTFLDFHHRDPHANGGPPTVENIALRCRAHNAYEAELVFGRYAPAADREWLPGGVAGWAP
jgi:hypothetical protein